MSNSSPSILSGRPSTRQVIPAAADKGVIFQLRVGTTTCPRRGCQAGLVGPVVDDSGEFRLRSVALAAYAPAALFGLAEGAMLPVIVASTYARGAHASTAAFIAALIGIGSLVTNIPSGILATRVGERRAMLVAAAITAAGLAL